MGQREGFPGEQRPVEIGMAAESDGLLEERTLKAVAASDVSGRISSGDKCRDKKSIRYK
jgi:hypothetical protein